jgi:undecaprenyl-diphosphatase
MNGTTLRTHALERLAAWDRRVCLRCNSACRFTGLRVAFVLASRLGDGPFWYALMGAMLISDGTRAATPVLHMIVGGLACTLIYKSLKRGTARARPYMAQAGITLFAAPLDKYSFPSGHTLHAVAFTLIALGYYPVLFWVLAPFCILVALSRVVLGLHYPSDVIAGAGMGAAVAAVSTTLL